MPWCGNRWDERANSGVARSVGGRLRPHGRVGTAPTATRTHGRKTDRATRGSSSPEEHAGRWTPIEVAPSSPSLASPPYGPQDPCGRVPEGW